MSSPYLKLWRHALYVLLAFLLLGVFLSWHRAQAADQIIRPFQGIRSLGMGNVKYTTGLYEENFYGNPARVTANPHWRLQLPDPMVEVSTSTISNISNISNSSNDTIQAVADTAGKNNHTRLEFSFPGLYLPNFLGSKWSFAAALLTSVQADAFLRKSFDIQPSVIADIGPNLTVGRKLLANDALSVGITTHVAYRLASPATLGFQDIIQGQSLAPNDLGQEGAQVDFSTGATYRLPFRVMGWELSPGAAVNNLLGGHYAMLNLRLIKTSDLGSPRQQPRIYNFGIAAHRDSFWKLGETSLAFEITDIGNNSGGSMFRLVHIGAETHWHVLALRAGINQGYWTAGLGIDLWALQIDAAYYGEELGLNVGDNEDRRIALRIAFQI